MGINDVSTYQALFLCLQPLGVRCRLLLLLQQARLYHIFIHVCHMSVMSKVLTNTTSNLHEHFYRLSFSLS